MSPYGLDEMLKLMIRWEKRLDSFYGAMEEYLADERARKTAFALQERQKKALEILSAIHIEDYEDTEYIRSVPDFHSEDLVPHFEIDARSSPKDVFETILGYELKLEAYYRHLLDFVFYEKSKEIIGMMLQFKTGQIKEIKGLMEHYDLAV